MGTVIVSVNIATGSIHANILFRGILKEGETRVPFTVRFQTAQGHETRSVEESVILDAPVAVSAKLIFTYFLSGFGRPLVARHPKVSQNG